MNSETVTLLAVDAYVYEPYYTVVYTLDTYNDQNVKDYFRIELTTGVKNIYILHILFFLWN